MKIKIERASAISRSARVAQVEGLFDIPQAAEARLEWDVDLPIEERDWRIGLIVGPSGCGKSTIARELWPTEYVNGFDWDNSKAVVDCFPKGMSSREVTMLLSSVGFSSPPAWLRPFGVLSNGEQFRVTMARAIASDSPLTVMDEFTSVVDRRVAQIGSHAVAKTIRRSEGKRFIAVSCHYDIEEWLDPDWVYQPADGSFAWRSLQGRPKVKIEIRRVPTSVWPLFAPHHYLTRDLNKSAKCFCAFIDDRPVAFHSYLPFVGRLRDKQKAMRGHRSVCLPDYQGLGIGNKMIDVLAGMWKALDYRVFRNTAHPAEIAGALRSRLWLQIRAPSFTMPDSKGSELGNSMAKSRASSRNTSSFEFIGERMNKDQAKQLLGQNTYG